MAESVGHARCQQENAGDASSLPPRQPPADQGDHDADTTNEANADFLAAAARGAEERTTALGRTMALMALERFGEAWAITVKLSRQHRVNMRTAAYMVSISRVATVHRLRGIYA